MASTKEAEARPASRCYECGNEAIGACSSCGRFYCNNHGGGRVATNLHGPGMAVAVCHDCYAAIGPAQTAYVNFRLVVGIIFFVIMTILGIMALMSRELSRRHFGP